MTEFKPGSWVRINRERHPMNGKVARVIAPDVRENTGFVGVTVWFPAKPTEGCYSFSVQSVSAEPGPECTCPRAEGEVHRDYCERTIAEQYEPTHPPWGEEPRDKYVPNTDLPVYFMVTDRTNWLGKHYAEAQDAHAYAHQLIPYVEPGKELQIYKRSGVFNDVILAVYRRNALGYVADYLNGTTKEFRIVHARRGRKRAVR